MKLNKLLLIPTSMIVTTPLITMCGCNKINYQYKEITKEEFLIQFTQICDAFWRKYTLEQLQNSKYKVSDDSFYMIGSQKILTNQTQINLIASESTTLEGYKTMELHSITSNIDIRYELSLEPTTLAQMLQDQYDTKNHKVKANDVEFLWTYDQKITDDTYITQENHINKSIPISFSFKSWFNTTLIDDLTFNDFEIGK